MKTEPSFGDEDAVDAPASRAPSVGNGEGDRLDNTAPGANEPPAYLSGIPPFFNRGTDDGAGGDGEPQDSMSQFISRTMTAVGEVGESELGGLLPPPPRTFGELGLSRAFLSDLCLKIIHYSGTPSMAQLIRRLGLGHEVVAQLLAGLTEERLIEILSQSDLYTGNYRYRLSERGHTRAGEALERSRYAGPAPVTADQYNEVLRRMHAQKQVSGRAGIKAILNEFVLSPEVSDSIARALFSGKAAILYGPYGNGKTVILERYSQNLEGFALVPYAIYAYGQVIRVFDLSIHQPLEDIEEANMVRDDGKMDRRWVVIKRPAVVLGAEMGLESLDMAYDQQARFYQAPPHIKAQGGALIVDDFGRQAITSRELLTRWLIPLERGWDTMGLVTGEKLTVPFQIQLLFGTNVRIRELGDDALLRRILYKVEIPNPKPEAFLEIMRRSCLEKQVLVTDGALDHVIQRLYSEPALKPRGSYARDLLEMLIQSAEYDGRTPVLDQESFDRVFRLFVAQEAGEDGHGQNASS